LENDLAILENNINIENKGKGRQCFIKTELALRSQQELNIILIEEPENHLSHINMQKLIQKISESQRKQIFIATHSDLISARLDLRKAILLNSNNITPLTLNGLSEETAKFFMKSPDNNILRFILSKKVILVEGDAEYLLMEAMYRKKTQEELTQSDVHVIAVGGTSFKRYLDIARILAIKTAVITDNDSDIDNKITQKYADYTNLENIKIFNDTDKARYTFEICFYNDNKVLCDALFASKRKTLSIKEFMLNNKADCAFSILENKANEITVPKYIQDAISWIKG
jgi:putative ATP-dependent endonuclease of the OLD family